MPLNLVVSGACAGRRHHLSATQLSVLIKMSLEESLAGNFLNVIRVDRKHETQSMRDVESRYLLDSRLTRLHTIFLPEVISSHCVVIFQIMSIFFYFFF